VTAEASRILDAQLSDGERAEIAAILTDSIGDHYNAIDDDGRTADRFLDEGCCTDSPSL
jgi:hypothetical protein